MKYLIIGLVTTCMISCSVSEKKKSKMEEVKIVEMVMWKSVEGISQKEAKEAISKLNEFVGLQPRFLSKTETTFPKSRTKWPAGRPGFPYREIPIGKSLYREI
ncbi:MAG: hypothetical protein HRT74_11370 [Flavobacteriales bacterium]|nr:hypothetical protein [Flavobacteriales bacterium]